METHEILSRAADVTDRVGHYLNTERPGQIYPDAGEDSSGALCVLRCIAKVTNETKEYFPARNACITLAQFLGFDSIDDIASWSDTHDHETVTSALRACAAIERAKLAAPVNQPHPEPAYAH